LIKETVKTIWSDIDVSENILFILTVPAEYTEGSKAIMRECANIAELIDDKHPKNLQFTTERK
jgi:hypothetical protein